MKTLALVFVAIIVIAIVGVGAMAVATAAPTCPAATGSARSVGEVDRVLSETKSVTLSEAEASAIARGYLPSPSPLSDVRVCFTPGKGHLSGEMPLGPFKPSFYASGAVDLTSARPRVTGLEIQLGSMTLPIVSDSAKSALSDLINQQLARIELKKRYSIEFRAGSAVVRELSP